MLIVIRASLAGVLIEVVTDCAAVFFGFRDLVRSTKYNKMHAGLWRQVVSAVREKTVVVTKTKAHRSYAEAVVQGDAEDFEGNDRADSLAKQVAREAAFRELQVLDEIARVTKVRAIRKYVVSALQAQK